MGKYGSTVKTRALVLEALGVVKIATAAQLRDLTCPGTADAATARGGCKDLEAAGLVVSAGTTTRVEGGRRITEKLWSLTTAGLEAAAAALERPPREMGGTARAAAASGAKHALRVTDVLAAFVQQPVEPTQTPVARTTTVPRQGALRRRPPGLGPLSAWSTEVTLPTGGTFSAPAKGSLRADAVFAMPGAPVPLLFVEVDNGTETRAQVADKLTRYARFFARTEKPGRADTAGGPGRPLWSTVWSASPTGPHPPVAIVFTKPMGAEAMDACMRGIAELSAPVWRGTWHGEGRTPDGRQDGYRTHDGAIPVVACRLDCLVADGPHGPIWWRYGRQRGGQTLAAALDNDGQADSYAAYAAREAERDRARQAQAAQQAAQQEAARRRREASAWPCPGCGRKVYPAGDLWGTATRPGALCTVCQSIADHAAEDARRRAEEEAAAAAEAKANGPLGWMRALRPGSSG